MMKTLTKILTLLLSAALLATSFACRPKNDDSTSGSGSGSGSAGKEPETPVYNVDYDYFHNFKMNDEKVLKVWRPNSDNNLIMVVIQGLINRDEITYFANAFSAQEYWLDDLKENHGVTTVDTNYDEMIAAYKEKFGDKAGYVLYDENNPESINVATSLCGILDAIPVDAKREREFSRGQGLVKLEDAREMDEQALFNSDYRDKFATDALFQLDPTVWYPRDYWVAGRYYGYYRTTANDPAELAFRNRVQSWTDDSSPIFGWGGVYEEYDVNIASNNNEFTIASDSSANLTVFASDAWGEEFKQKPNEKPVTAQMGKHYVTIMMSDGDNIQALSNTFPMQGAYYQAPRADFKMGWTMNVSCVDIQPNIIGSIYRNMDENDYFVASVSGNGYIFPSGFSDEALETFTKRLGSYLERADTHSLQILENSIDPDKFEYYSKIEGLYGCAVMYGDRYQAMHGSVWWKNGMPFVSCRFSLWDLSGINSQNVAMSIAANINACKKDPTSIEGYSVVNVHPWSTTYNDVVKLVENLDENVVVVTADDFFRMIRDNVPQVDVEL